MGKVHPLLNVVDYSILYVSSLTTMNTICFYYVFRKKTLSLPMIKASHFKTMKISCRTRPAQGLGRVKLQEFQVCLSTFNCLGIDKIEPPHGKTNNLHRRKQRRRSASR